MWSLWFFDNMDKNETQRVKRQIILAGVSGYSVIFGSVWRYEFNNRERIIFLNRALRDRCNSRTGLQWLHSWQNMISHIIIFPDSAYMPITLFTVLRNFLCASAPVGAGVKKISICALVLWSFKSAWHRIVIDPGEWIFILRGDTQCTLLETASSLSATQCR